MELTTRRAHTEEKWQLDMIIGVGNWRLEKKKASEKKKQMLNGLTMPAYQTGKEVSPDWLIAA